LLCCSPSIGFLLTLLRGVSPQAGIGNVMPPSLAVRLAKENITARKRSKSTRGFSVL
jgi:hypothetical protein